MTESAPPPPDRLAEAHEAVSALRAEIARAVVGQDEVVTQVLAAFLAGGHVLLEGVPGLGKTLIVLALSRAFGGRFARVQFTPDLMPSDVTGHAILDVKTGEMSIRRGPAFTHLLLADEINRAPAKTQAALLEVMGEQQISIEGTSFPLEGPFMTLATQNPLEHEGTYPLPEAQLDRFLLKVLIDYPAGVEEEIEVLRRVTAGQTGDRLDVAAVREVASPESVRALQDFTASLTVDERIHDYAVRLVRRSRERGDFRFGAGPRGAIALVRTARSFALLEGRDHVLPDDVKRAVLPALRHRVQPAPELAMEGHSSDALLRGLVDEVVVPRA